MRSSSSCSVFALGLVAFAFAACVDSSSGDGAPGAQPGPGGDPTNPDAPAGETPKAPPVGGPAASEELTEKFGVFVAPTGADNADGTRERPLARIQPAIDLAKKLGKRVYVCTGVYREALVLADSISVIGGLDCSTPIWRVGAARTRIESPTIPAIEAKDIASATRLESLDVLAPAATTPGGSSFALRAEHAGALVIASSRIVAGDAAKGADGVEGVQLTNAATANGAPGVSAKNCNLPVTTISCANTNFKPARAAGGSNLCQGAAGITAGPGGYGGSGGHWEAYAAGIIKFKVYAGNVALYEEPGNLVPTSAVGPDGQAGSNGSGFGGLSGNEYQPLDGRSGSQGGAGVGGAGGDGRPPQTASTPVGAVWYGNTGSGGGAGGCPGLSGTAGKGGGASIAALLLDSPLTLDATELLAGHGGGGGIGTFGSAPTAGGQPGGSAGDSLPGNPGGRGGFAGFSGNGGTGPSIAVAHIGPAPKVVGATKMLPGAGGDAIPERTTTLLGVTRTIPASPAGLTKDILAL